MWRRRARFPRRQAATTLVVDDHGVNAAFADLREVAFLFDDEFGALEGVIQPRPVKALDEHPELNLLWQNPDQRDASLPLFCLWHEGVSVA